ncbi:MAG TPA: TetR/AcrR family transcriptional regulator [Microbacteriaceae bacterium]|nr:TetR/AcrR family transcriptional regulator [Microbacteriaceae bacterium]
MRRQSNEMRRRQNTKQILNVAQSLLIRSGYVAATMDRIATASSLTKGAVYFYFPSKEVLVGELIERAKKSFFDPSLELLNQNELGVTERFVNYFNFAGALVENHDMYLLPLTLSIQQDAIPESLFEQIKDLYKRTHRALTEAVAEGQRSGEFATKLPAEVHASQIIATMDGMLHEWGRRSNEISGREFMRAARTGILASLQDESLQVDSET